MNTLFKSAIVKVKPQRRIFFGLLLLVLPAGAQSPTSLAIPSVLTVSGTISDSIDGVSSGTTVFQTISATNGIFPASTVPQTTTYTYSKTGTNTATLTYQVISSDIDFSETENSTILLTFTSATSGTITLSGSYSGVEDDEPYSGSYTGSGTFTYTSSSPSISNVSDLTIAKNTATPVLSFTIGDADTAIQLLTVTRASSNTTLVPLANVVLGGSNASRTVTVTPATNQTGTATITLTVSDGVNSTNETFVLTVTDGLTLNLWRQTHFGNSANTGDGADLNDFDSDGRVNLMEYALGSLPKNPMITHVPVVAVEVFSSQPYLTMTLTKPVGITGVTYTVEVSGILGVWSSGGANTTVITNNATTLKVRDNTPASGGKRFIRLKVTNP